MTEIKEKRKGSPVNCEQTLRNCIYLADVCGTDVGQPVVDHAGVRSLFNHWHHQRRPHGRVKVSRVHLYSDT